jgi:hypothetical protein
MMENTYSFLQTAQLDKDRGRGVFAKKFVCLPFCRTKGKMALKTPTTTLEAVVSLLVLFFSVYVTFCMGNLLYI